MGANAWVCVHGPWAVRLQSDGQPCTLNASARACAGASPRTMRGKASTDGDGDGDGRLQAQVWMFNLKEGGMGRGLRLVEELLAADEECVPKVRGKYGTDVYSRST